MMAFGAHLRLAAAIVGLAMTITIARAASVEAIDDRGQTVRLAAPAQRIVSLAPHVTELLYAAGAGSRIVGAVEYSDYPPAARQLPRVGDTRSLDLERIVALKPDLVVVWLHGSSQRQLDVLRAMGLPLYYDEPHRLDDIPRSLERLGHLAGSDGAASRAGQDFTTRLAALRSRYASQRPVSVFYQVWRAPLMTINGHHIISDVITSCGGRNVFAELPMLVPQPGIEAVIERDPMVIMTAGMSGSDDAFAFESWTTWPQLQAVRHQRLVTIPGDLISRHTPRLLDAAEQVCQALDAARRDEP